MKRQSASSILPACHPDGCGRTLAMGVRRSLALIAIVVGVGSNAATAGAATGNTKFGGSTDQGREAKLVADAQGRVVRGSFTVMTDCSGRFEPFRARVELRAPLDRSTQDGFRDRASTLDEDGEFSGRYRHEIEGEYTGPHKIKGTLTLTVVFRRNGEEYVTCEAVDLGFVVKEPEQGK